MVVPAEGEKSVEPPKAYVAELRGLRGSGHGREGRAKGLRPRHTRLVVGVAASLVTFLPRDTRGASEL